MGFRFKKSIKLGKGIKLNLGKKSAGISVGGKHGGISINSQTGARARVSVPGTGISYSTKLSGNKKSKRSPKSETRTTQSVRAGQMSRVGSEQSINTAKKIKSANPPKPPKSPKIYLPCGILMTIIGVLFLFLFWPIGFLAIALGIYYIACGPKIYSNLVANYKAVHPEYEEGQ